MPSLVVSFYYYLQRLPLSRPLGKHLKVNKSFMAGQNSTNDQLSRLGKVGSILDYKDIMPEFKLKARKKSEKILLYSPSSQQITSQNSENE